MKKLQFLKALLDLIWLSSIVAIVGIAAFIIYIFIHGSAGIPIKLDGQNIDISNNPTKILVVFGIVAYGIFVYGIFELRKLLALFSKRLIFEDENIVLLNRIGKSFLVSAALVGIPLLVYNVFCRSSVYIEIGSGFGSLLFAASLGLFFMVLSEVFKVAQMMKNENDLTV